VLAPHLERDLRDHAVAALHLEPAARRGAAAGGHRQPEQLRAALPAARELAGRVVEDLPRGLEVAAREVEATGLLPRRPAQEQRGAVALVRRRVAVGRRGERVRLYYRLYGWAEGHFTVTLRSS
jgi:hypothetical protein